MAKPKKKGKKKSTKRTVKRRDEDQVIEILLPPGLHERVERIRAADSGFIDETIRAVFDTNELFGITAVRLNPKSRPGGTGSYYKLCEANP